jgi:hypothetical protein
VREPKWEEPMGVGDAVAIIARRQGMRIINRSYCCRMVRCKS